MVTFIIRSSFCPKREEKEKWKVTYNQRNCRFKLLLLKFSRRSSDSIFDRSFDFQSIFDQRFVSNVGYGKLIFLTHFGNRFNEIFILLSINLLV
uniref:Uncharacterized protein n=1 Tax=Anopheles atroparvus TaxID=41427 RepID=A0AAG5D5Y3_ANOAO